MVSWSLGPAQFVGARRAAGEHRLGSIKRSCEWKILDGLVEKQPSGRKLEPGSGVHRNHPECATVSKM